MKAFEFIAKGNVIVKKIAIASIKEQVNQAEVDSLIDEYVALLLLADDCFDERTARFIEFSINRAMVKLGKAVLRGELK